MPGAIAGAAWGETATVAEVADLAGAGFAASLAVEAGEGAVAAAVASATDGGGGCSCGCWECDSSENNVTAV